MQNLADSVLITCQPYLNYTDDASTPLKHPHEGTNDIVDALLNYAAEYWSEHYRHESDQNEFDNNRLDQRTLAFLKNPDFRKRLYDIFLPSASKLDAAGFKHRHGARDCLLILV